MKKARQTIYLLEGDDFSACLTDEWMKAETKLGLEIKTLHAV